MHNLAVTCSPEGISSANKELFSLLVCLQSMLLNGRVKQCQNGKSTAKREFHSTIRTRDLTSLPQSVSFCGAPPSCALQECPGTNNASWAERLLTWRCWLSLQDLMALDCIPSLISAGVSCLKIEGRLKVCSRFVHCSFGTSTA